MLDYVLGFFSSNSKTYSALTYMDFLKSSPPKKNLYIKTLLQANFYMVPKLAEHLQQTFKTQTGFLNKLDPSDVS